MDRDPEGVPTTGLTAAANAPLSDYQYEAGVFIGGMEVQSLHVSQIRYPNLVIWEVRNEDVSSAPVTTIDPRKRRSVATLLTSESESSAVFPSLRARSAGLISGRGTSNQLSTSDPVVAIGPLLVAVQHSEVAAEWRPLQASLSRRSD
jgi:hypothetical protein